MAELLSVQVHVPITKGEDGKLLEKTQPNPHGFTRLKKVDNKGKQQESRFAYLAKRKPVTISFSGLTYSVSEGSKRSK